MIAYFLIFYPLVFLKILIIKYLLSLTLVNMCGGKMRKNSGENEENAFENLLIHW